MRVTPPATTYLCVPLVTERADFAPNAGAPAQRSPRWVISQGRMRSSARRRTVSRVFLMIALTVEAEK